MLIEDTAALSPTSTRTRCARSLSSPQPSASPTRRSPRPTRSTARPVRATWTASRQARRRVLALAQKGDTTATQHAQTEAEAFVDATDDVLARRLTRLAGAEALGALGADGADELRSATRAELVALGAPAEGWATAFRLAALGHGAGEGVVS